MGLLEIIEVSPELRDKHVKQIIGIAGNGKLTDESKTSLEFREFLSIVKSELLSRYASDCLTDKFEKSGYALQDIINQIGRRLGFKVEDGRYSGLKGQVGHDGIWLGSNHESIVVEVKTTDAFRIDLNTVAKYRKQLIKIGKIGEENASILVVVGREDTGDLEAQVRGSKYAWDIRLISVDSLVRLMLLKESLEDPRVSAQIRDILKPREFTKVDDIIELVFSTAEDVIESGISETEVRENKEKKFTPVSFHDECITRISEYLKVPLIKRSRATFDSKDGNTTVVCAVSKIHGTYNQPSFWFAFHPHQKDILTSGKNSYLAFGCGSPQNVLLIPFKKFKDELVKLNITEKIERMYWHVIISNEDDKYILHPRKEFEQVDLTEYLI